MPAASAAVRSNQELGRHFFAEQDRLRGGPAAELCAVGYKARIGSYPEMDRAGHEGFAVAFYSAFPDMRHVIDEVVSDDSRVVVRFTLKGTQTGSFFGIPATGKPVNVGAIAILRVEAGQVVALDAVFDEAGMLRQLGVLG